MKTYIIDTNVLIQAPHAVYCFEEHLVVLPVVVLEELDNLKKSEGERGANARTAIRILEKLRQEGDLLQGVPLKKGGLLRIEKNFIDVDLGADFPDKTMDNRILKVCLGLSKKMKAEQVSENEAADSSVILVTKDILLRIKAQILGIRAEDFATEQVSDREEQYTGREEAFVPEDLLKEFKKKGIPGELLYKVDENGTSFPVKLEENQFIVLQGDQSAKKTLLGRMENSRIVPLSYKKT